MTTILEDWDWSGRRYVRDEADGSLATLEGQADGPVRGVAKEIRFGWPLVGDTRLVWACAAKGGLLLGIDGESYFSGDGVISVSWKSSLPFVRRMTIRHGDGEVFSAWTFDSGVDGDFEHDMEGSFGSFLQHVFSSKQTMEKFAAGWATGIRMKAAH
jgi:hypothetical protein